MMLLLLSFNYTPPPPEVVNNGYIAIAVLFALLILVPNVKLGAFIGGLGVAIIIGLVQSYAGGDLGGLSVITHPPVYAAVGAPSGAFISFIGRSAWQALRKQSSSNATPNEPE